MVIYEGVTSTLTASLETIKLHWNSVISTKGAKYCTIDLKDFFLQANLTEHEYIRIPLDIIPQDFIEQYNLKSLVYADDFACAEVRGGMHGLPQV